MGGRKNPFFIAEYVVYVRGGGGKAASAYEKAKKVFKRERGVMRESGKGCRRSTGIGWDSREECVNQPWRL